MRDITLCHPRLQKLATELIQKCSAQGLQIKIGETLRTRSRVFDTCVITSFQRTPYK